MGWYSHGSTVCGRFISLVRWYSHGDVVCRHGVVDVLEGHGGIFNEEPDALSSAKALETASRRKLEGRLCAVGGFGMRRNFTRKSSRGYQ